jgi:cytidine deaminase
MKTFKVETEVKVFSSLKELSEEDQNLVKHAREAAKGAYAPYSRFNVGAALLLENGTIVKGNNQENAAYPSGICAERVAVFAAGANYPGIKIKTMAVTAFSANAKIDSPITPCGSCRQVMSEYETKSSSDIRLILCADCDEIWVLESVKSTLPLLFSSKSLK